MNDGCIDLVWTQSSSKRKFLSFFDQTATGDFIDSDFVEHNKVHAFVVSPKKLPKDGNLGVDGERVNYFPFAMQVHASVLSLICQEPSYFDTSG